MCPPSAYLTSCNSDSIYNGGYACLSADVHKMSYIPLDQYIVSRLLTMINIVDPEVGLPIVIVTNYGLPYCQDLTSQSSLFSVNGIVT